MERLMTELKHKISEMKKNIGNSFDLSDERLNELYSVYPFNKFEYIISHLIAAGTITLQEYLDLRQSYISRNKYLHLFELAPRTFGETWGQKYLMEHIPELQIPTKALDPLYVGQYDLFFNNIHIEVKASRAVAKIPGKTLSDKALLYAQKDTAKYLMNFQQLKPSCCDVYVWIAVWKDNIVFWVIPSDDVKHNRNFSPQHRQEKQYERGMIFEGQIQVTQNNITDFDKYLVSSQEILNAIMERGRH